MSIVERPDLTRYIPKDTFNVCVLDGKTKVYILELYAGKVNGAYYVDKFDRHLQNNHKMTIRDYCINILKIDWPKCPITNELVGCKSMGYGLELHFYKRYCGLKKKDSAKFAAACEKMSQDRKGERNPMYGKKAWNDGLTKDTDETVAKVARQRVGMKFSEKTKAKQRKNRAEHPLKARHITPHSPETVEIMRLETAKRWASGVFNRVTSIHIKMREFLKTLDLVEPFVEEFQVIYFSMDFAFPNAKIAIECQGQYFHIDPRFYPNGPMDAIQRRNFGRDITKKKVCEGYHGWKIIEVWEAEINDGQFKEIIKCKLLELGLLKASE